MNIIPTFFGVEIIPNHTYKANIQHELILTRATLDPNAKDDQNARLFVNIEKEEGPVCHLNCNQTTLPLCIRVSPGAQLILRVAGNCSIHVSGYTSPDSKEKSLINEIESGSDTYYYEEDIEESDSNIQDNNDAKEKNEEAEK